jgi:NADH-quinone oxidoreductase subunit J
VTAQEVAFTALGVVTFGSAVLVVASRNLVHAALWLVVTLGALAGEYLLLTAEFVAWVQVLIYVGAVVVLLLFGLMLTRAPIGYSDQLTGPNRWAAAAVSVATAVTLVTVLVQGFRDAVIDLDRTGGGTARATGEALFRNWVLPFEVLSVLLLAALVGAIVLSRTDIGTPPTAAGDGAGGKPAGDRAQVEGG